MKQPSAPSALAPRSHRAARLRVVLTALLFAAAIAPAQAVGAGPTIASVAVAPSPFSPNGDGVREATRFSVVLARSARLTVEVTDLRGRLVRTLLLRASRGAGTHSFRWTGRDANGRLVPNAAYRFRATAVNGLGTAVVRALVTKADHVVYAPRPGAIVVALNPGHGSPDPGAYYGGYEESDLNLDIAFRLRAMLQGAGVKVVMTRTTDRAVNVPASDWTGNGEITRADEFAARLDIANVARADMLVTLMNNAYGCHCVHGTETFTNPDRTWYPAGRRLASLIQREHITELSAYRSSSWSPVDRGVRLYDYYVMRPYDRVRVPRPALMPSVLTESLFMDYAPELRLLARARVRQTIAEAYYDGIARYLNGRAYGMGYTRLAAPTTATTGTTVRYELALTNRGMATSSGWKLRLAYVPARPMYDGSGAPGTTLRTVAIPNGLAPGATTRLRVDVPAPPYAGSWLVKADVVLASGARLSDQGVVSLQLPLTTTGGTAASSDALAPASVEADATGSRTKLDRRAGSDGSDGSKRPPADGPDAVPHADHDH